MKKVFGVSVAVLFIAATVFAVRNTTHSHRFWHTHDVSVAKTNSGQHIIMSYKHGHRGSHQHTVGYTAGDSTENLLTTHSHARGTTRSGRTHSHDEHIVEDYEHAHTIDGQTFEHTHDVGKSYDEPTREHRHTLSHDHYGGRDVGHRKKHAFDGEGDPKPHYVISNADTAHKVTANHRHGSGAISSDWSIHHWHNHGKYVRHKHKLRITSQ